MTRRNWSGLIAAVALAFASLGAHAQAHNVYTLQHIWTTVPGDSHTVPFTITDLNNKGEVVGERPGQQSRTGFVWRNGEFRDLNPLFGPGNSRANAINDRSDVLLTFQDPEFQTHYFLLLRDETRVPIELPEGANIAIEIDLNNHREVLLAAFDSQGSSKNYVWRGGEFTLLEPINGTTTNASALNDHGTVVGAATTTDFAFSNPVLWQHGTPMLLDRPAGADRAFGTDVNDSEVVVGAANFNATGHLQSFLWREGELRLLPLPSGRTDAFGADINNRGVVVGESFSNSFDSIPAIWRRGRAADLNALLAQDDPLQPFVHLERATLINDRGQIVVQGRDSRDPAANLSFYLLTPQL